MVLTLIVSLALSGAPKTDAKLVGTWLAGGSPFVTFYANGTVSTSWDDIAQFRGVSEGDVVRFAISKPEPLQVEHQNFRDAVLGKEADIVTLEQGMATVAVAEAVIESAQTGKTVDLPRI